MDIRQMMWSLLFLVFVCTLAMATLTLATKYRASKQTSSPEIIKFRNESNAVRLTRFCRLCGGMDKCFLILQRKVLDKSTPHGSEKSSNVVFVHQNKAGLEIAQHFDRPLYDANTHTTRWIRRRWVKRESAFTAILRSIR